MPFAQRAMNPTSGNAPMTRGGGAVLSIFFAGTSTGDKKVGLVKRRFGLSREPTLSDLLLYHDG